MTGSYGTTKVSFTFTRKYKTSSLVCWHCHPRSINYKERSRGWRISILIDACMWKYLQKHTSVISQNNPDCTSEHCSLYDCMNMHHPFANLPTSQSSRWSHSALQRKPSSDMCTREQVLQLTLHEKNQQTVIVIKRKKRKEKGGQQWHRNADSLAQIRKINTTEAKFFFSNFILLSIMF